MKNFMSRRRISNILTNLVLLAVLIASTVNVQQAQAATSLTITPITWNVIGLDSNNVNVGPNDFPVGARVCNPIDNPTSTVTSINFVWDGWRRCIHQQFWRRHLHQPAGWHSEFAVFHA